MTYEEYLTSLGASEEDLKVLNTPKIRAGWEKVEAERTAAEQRAVKAEEDRIAYDKWYNEQAMPAYQKALQDAAEARGEAAKERARLKAMQESGLAAVAAEPETPPATPTSSGVITSDSLKEYVRADDFLKAYESTGDAIATASEIMQDHRELFGTKVPMKELLDEARRAKKPVREVWEQKYNVSGKRQEIEAKAKADYEAKIRSEERQKVLSEVGNPETRPLMPSRNPFTSKPVGDANAAPWAKSEDTLAKARVDKAVKNLPVQ